MEENTQEIKQVKKRGRPRKQIENSENLNTEETAKKVSKTTTSKTNSKKTTDNKETSTKKASTTKATKTTKKTTSEKEKVKEEKIEEVKPKKEKVEEKQEKKRDIDEIFNKMLIELDEEIAENKKIKKAEKRIELEKNEKIEEQEDVEEKVEKPKKEKIKKEKVKKEKVKKDKKIVENEQIVEDEQIESIEDLENIEKEESKELVVKDDIKEISIDNEKLDKIEEERKKQKSIPEEKKKKINKLIFKNILIAIIIVTYFIFVNLGYYNLEKDKYMLDLKVFSIVTIGITVILFERAYKKDDDYIALNGIEILALSIVTLLLEYICTTNESKYTYITNLISMIFGIYYTGKSIIIYIKMRKKSLKIKNDIRKIAK